ncbi:MAG: carboxypeptidase-like regulatory domain-containing protein [Bacteroidota bacterium]|nr:MAG: carboxypeptidase-like regulatory domain-containing protein [Bacteroidota bacterium]
MKKTITLFICLFSLSLATWAQDKTVTGKVTSSQDKLGIPGVSILEPGTTNGTVSDIDGKYSIKVKSTTTQLRFSGTGLTTRTVDIPASNSLDLTMQPDVQKIGEVVVTALGIKRE